ncbi:MAG: helix-turn-helix transcriptional regulator [Actinomycetota bacterium]
MSMPIHVAKRLRYFRQQQNLTLKQVEIRSRGKWKAVVIGSYERGVRALSIAKAAELCAFYGVPLESLFLKDKPVESGDFSRGLVLDLRQIRNRLNDGDRFTHQLHDLIYWIATKRSDWNGEVISLRTSDSDVVMLVTRKTQSELADSLTNRGFWLTKPDRA